MYNPAMWCIPMLATMEVKIMSTCEISLFLKLFNEMLSAIMEIDYTFNPKVIMVNENSTIHCMIRQVFGVNFMTSDVVSCWMHYMNDVNRLSFKTGPSYRNFFKGICYGMCSVATMAEYNESKQ